PMLVEGPPGVGKTEIAKALAGSLNRRLIRLQCYEGLDESKALYEWEYTKQLLYTQMLKDRIGELLVDTQTIGEAVEILNAQDSAFFSEHFLLPRPLLEAILSPDPVVLLIDEVDRSDDEFESFLLEVLSDFQVSIPELGTLSARQRPLVVLTSNANRNLSEALRRRCLYLYIDYPAAEQETTIVMRKAPDVGQELAEQIVRFAQKVRAINLRKPPSISETIDWALALVVLNAKNLSKETLSETLNVLLKDKEDIDRIIREGVK
ncbi:MAG: MoxR family ATPase, partial [Candidatus Latescibacteria bacterium]|nr:MoxR family ATPase [Candidatus Latescibacterota bacterium]